jgi:SAM-dependent methyltransferase
MEKNNYCRIKVCRICGSSNLTEILNFGDQYLASVFVKSNADNELAKIKIPLTVVLCGVCGLVQLRETVKRDLMYRSYFYRSSTNPMMREALQEIVNAVSSQVNLKKGDNVLDIGCNDGIMLTYYPDYVNRIGIDPAKNIDRSWLDPEIKVAADYFSKAAALRLSNNQPFKIITSIAMFYDLDDPNSFVSEVKSILASDGVWCIQLSYLPAALKTLNFYDVCHEHLEYYTIRALENLLNKHDFVIFDASLNDVNGGSLRVFVTHKNFARPISNDLKAIFAAEDKMRLTDSKTYADFSLKIADLKRKITDFLVKAKNAGKKVVGLGASTKGNVLLQFFNITKDLLPYISERNPEKVGLRTLGTDIELISEESARNLKPDAMLVLIWFFKDELIKREKEYLEKGGQLVFPMPYPHVITKEGENLLS